MQYPKIQLAQSVLTICKQNNIKHIVISPGSRNAPLTIGFASDSYFKPYSIADERCAAFFALGMAQQLKEPVAIVCTSGSALLNYYPAIAEAFYSQIPLIVISADRPTSKIDIGDGQTIRQANVFENHILFNANLEENVSVANDTLIHNAIYTAVLKKGPVHINAPFEEPLYDIVSELSVSPKAIEQPKQESVAINWDFLQSSWDKAAKKLILIGVQDQNVIPEHIIQQWNLDPSIVVLTEVTSNIRTSNFINSIDSLITSFTDAEFKMLQPDILISIGGMVVSKRIKKFFRSYKPAAHWHVDLLRAYDTFGALTQHVVATPSTFFSKMTYGQTASNYQQNILNCYNSLREHQAEFVKQAPYSDLKVFEAIFNFIPKNSLLHISNSSAIRYAQLIDMPQDLEVFCNRGTSGIDGCTSTAIGAAVQTLKPTTLITGDISFLYDSNGLWNKYTPDNFKIIVLNNGGGGIFRILPGHQDTEVFNTYFETEHQHTAEHLAKMYDYEYIKAESQADLAKLETFFNSPKKQIIEIFTPTKINNIVLKNYFTFPK
nr:2-succinyl-5-enolpyruvyl-6-hydroxy-3-cyclohexene-1-carboxylic-acid synthase [uncultured Flavobacterium sp.]